MCHVKESFLNSEVRIILLLGEAISMDMQEEKQTLSSPC